MAERRYTEDEAAMIFERAAEEQAAPRGQLAAGGGLTLRELQDIGREVGIPADLIASASRALDHPANQAPVRFLGVPIGVSRTVELGRRLTEEEWERLVVDLRETFDARGRVHAHGAFREWTNGNLQALLEPTEQGHRLRLRTTKGDARNWMTTGAVLLAIVPVLLMIALMSPQDTGLLAAITTLAASGAAMVVLPAIRLPGWAALRQQQMDEVAARLTAACATNPAPPRSVAPSADATEPEGHP